MIWTAIVTFESRIILESFNFCNTISLEQLLQNFRRVNFINLLRVKCQVAFVFYKCMYLYPVFSCIFSDFFFEIVLHCPSLRVKNVLQKNLKMSFIILHGPLFEKQKLVYTMQHLYRLHNLKKVKAKIITIKTVKISSIKLFIILSNCLRKFAACRSEILRYKISQPQLMARCAVMEGGFRIYL